jgi:cardiolipin synthase A/B
MPQNQIQFFFEGDAYYKQLWDDIENAKHSILIEMYILANDEIGEKLKILLIAKADQGLKIRLMIDAIGSSDITPEYINELKQHHIEVKVFHPLRLFPIFKSTINKRNHRKVIVIDRRVGYLGGFNLSRENSKALFGEKRWRDTQIRLQGHMVDKLTYYCLRSFKVIRFRSRRQEKFFGNNDILATRNLFGVNPIRKYFHRYIRRSKNYIYIATAYFVPNLETMYLLTRARKRGVKVVIITNGENSDVPTVSRVNRPLLKYLIKRGVEIYDYSERMMHAKTAIIDGKIATVGSVNINYRSFFRDHEICAFLRRESWIKTLQSQFEEDLSLSKPITLESLKQSFFGKIVDGLFYLIRSFF